MTGTNGSRLTGLLGTTHQNLKVTALKLPKSLVTIGESAFRNHYKLDGDLIIPASVELINKSAFRVGSNNHRESKVTLRFAANSKLKEIGPQAFEERSIVGLTRLPESLETIGNVAFYAAFSENISSFTIPANVKSIGLGAFAPGLLGSRLTGTLTVESPHLIRTPPLNPPNTPAPKTGRLGESLLHLPPRGASRRNQLTAIYLHRAVFDSYSRADLEAIFGTFAKDEGKYVDIADKTTELTK